MTFRSYAEPGMPAIMKRFGNCIEADDIFIKISADFQIHDIEGYMVEGGLGFCEKFDFWVVFFEWKVFV